MIFGFWKQCNWYWSQFSAVARGSKSISSWSRNNCSPWMLRSIFKKQLRRKPKINKTFFFFPEKVSFISKDYLYVCCEGMSLCISMRWNIFLRSENGLNCAVGGKFCHKSLQFAKKPKYHLGEFILTDLVSIRRPKLQSSKWNVAVVSCCNWGFE